MKYCMNEIFLGLFLSTLISGCANDKETTGFWQEMQTKTALNTGAQRTGEQIYKNKCYECHDRNTQGAPMPDDYYEWSLRYQKGMDVLVKHAVNGFNQGLMPKRGGCRDCTEDELKNTIIYILKRSGVQVDDQ